MKKKLLFLFLALVLIFGITKVDAQNLISGFSSGNVITSLWEYKNTYIVPFETLDIGATGDRIPNIYATNMNTNTITINTASEGKLTIDVTDPEAFLTRRDADAGDLVVFDTTNFDIGFFGGAEFSPTTVPSTAILIDQNYNHISLDIDSEATSATVLNIAAANTSGDLFKILNTSEMLALDYLGNLDVAQDVDVGDDILLADGAVIGIAGNEVITWNAAGSINFTGATVDIDGAFTAGSVASDATVSGTTITASTGFALGTTDWIGITGNEIITFNEAGSINITGATFDVDGAMTAGTITSDAGVSGTILYAGDGTAAAPSITFTSDTDTGLFRLSADELSLGAGGDEGLRIDYNELEVQPLMTLAVGPIELDEDSGAVTLVNLPVSATPADNTEESYSFAIDSNPVLTVYGLADSSGGTDTHSITINGSAYILEQADAYADTATYGQLWVNTATPNELYFTTDAGDDREIAYAGGAFHDGFSDFVANEHIDWTSASVAFSTSGSVGTGTISATGAITSSFAGSLGWSVIANTTPDTTSCTTSCTTACVFGWDDTGATILDCASLVPDKCVCAGAN